MAGVMFDMITNWKLHHSNHLSTWSFEQIQAAIVNKLPVPLDYYDGCML